MGGQAARPRRCPRGVLALKNGSSGSAGQDACATPWRAVQRSILRMSSATSACRRSARSATGQSPFTGCAWPPDSAQASGTPAAARAACRRATRSCGRNGESPAALATHSRSGRLRAAQSSARGCRRAVRQSPARRPATTVRPVVGKARRIAVGVEDQRRALRREALDRAREDRPAGNRLERLVAAPHPPRQPAGEEDAEGRGSHARKPLPEGEVERAGGASG